MKYTKAMQAKMLAEHDIRIALKKEGKVYINVSLKQLKIYNITFKN